LRYFLKAGWSQDRLRFDRWLRDPWCQG